MSDARNQTLLIEITPEMAEVGTAIILREPGVAVLGVTFSGLDLARRFYEAMELG
jgi:hypothetical protein